MQMNSKNASDQKRVNYNKKINELENLSTIDKTGQ